MSTDRVTILIAAHDQKDREALVGVLQRSALTTEVLQAEAAAELRDRSREDWGSLDCAVIDDELPGCSGVELVRELRDLGVITPIILLTEDGSEALAVEAIRAGANDSLAKPDVTVDRLTRRVMGAVRVGRAERRAAETQRALLAVESAAREQAERAAAAREDMLSIVSHDLRGPLNAIGIAAEELSDPDLEPEERRHYAAAIARGVKRANRLIEDLLDVNRIDKGSLKVTRVTVDIAKLLQRAATDVELEAKRRNIDVRLEIDDDVGMVPADPDRIRQALQNLTNNALSHTDAGGQIVLSARREGDELELAVADTGSGIPADLVPHLFDRYHYQARSERRGHAGLGLAIVKGVVEAHGGSVGVHSIEGEGSRFSIILPVTDGP